jgi:hypothetical protein
VTQPSYVPIAETDQVRPAYRLKVPSVWTQSRPSELLGTAHPRGERFGVPGPDQGYALRLARRFVDWLILSDGESVEDAMVGCTAVAMRRCARFGRAPAVYDLEFAYTLWGFLGGAPAELVEARAPLFRSAAHHYEAQRAIAAAVNEETLPLTPEGVAARLDQWCQLVTLPDGH